MEIEATEMRRTKDIRTKHSYGVGRKEFKYGSFHQLFPIVKASGTRVTPQDNDELGCRFNVPTIV